MKLLPLFGATLALLCSTSAAADVLIDNVKGVRIDEDGDVDRFTGLWVDDDGTILLGQPPEVLKGLLLHGISNFDTLVLPDVKEKNGSLTNSMEFPLYFFLFVSNGLADGRKHNLVGEEDDISHALRLLRIT